MTSHLRLSVSLAAALLAAACSSDSPTSPPSSQQVNVAQLFSEFSAPGVASAVAVLPSTIPAPTILTGLTGSCPYDTASRSFVCATSTSSGITYAVTYQLLDAAGNPLGASADKSTTAAMHATTRVTGTLTLPPSATGGTSGPVTLSQQGDMTLSGLLGTTHTLNGTSKLTLTGAVALGSGTTAVSASTTETVKDLAIPASSSSGLPYPRSGTITVDASSTLGTAPPIPAHAVMTFDGTSTATIVLTVGGVTQRCTVNLATPTASACVAA